jgi:hypothetical protein
MPVPMIRLFISRPFHSFFSVLVVPKLQRYHELAGGSLGNIRKIFGLPSGATITLARTDYTAIEVNTHVRF